MIPEAANRRRLVDLAQRRDLTVRVDGDNPWSSEVRTRIARRSALPDW